MNAKFNVSFGALLVFSFIAIALYANWFSSIDPNFIVLEQRYQPPSSSHFLGLDQNGRDVFTQIAFGAKVSLIVCFSVVLISVLVGLILGSIAGYFGGFFETLIMRTIDVIHSFPNILLAIALVSFLGPSLLNLILAMTISSWTGFARLVRGEVLHIKKKEFVKSAQALGASAVWTIVRHIWPNLMGVVFAQASFALAGAIIAEAGLSFLGLGVSSDTPTWGSILNSGRAYMTEAPHVVGSAGGCIFFLVLGFYLLGDGLREILDPRRSG